MKACYLKEKDGKTGHLFMGKKANLHNFVEDYKDWKEAKTFQGALIDLLEGEEFEKVIIHAPFDSANGLLRCDMTMDAVKFVDCAKIARIVHVLIPQELMGFIESKHGRVLYIAAIDMVKKCARKEIKCNYELRYHAIEGHNNDTTGLNISETDFVYKVTYTERDTKAYGEDGGKKTIRLFLSDETDPEHDKLLGKVDFRKVEVNYNGGFGDDKSTGDDTEDQ